MEGNTGIFKACPCCGQAWPTRDDFLEDPELKTVGYQVNLDELQLGLFLLNHQPCMGTLAIQAGDMRDLYDGPVFEERKTRSDECPEYCLYEHELERCPAKCECAYVREVLHLVVHWPKKHLENQQ